MFTRIILASLLALSLSGCIITPEIEFTQRIDFDYVPSSPAQPMSYNDLLCCEQCTA